MWLQQSTATTIPLGPFVDETDGKTPETALTISQADVRLSKNGGDFAQKNLAAALVHDEFGYYPCGLDATDTATLGRLHIAVTESGALPWWDKYLVIPENEYASLVLGTDALEVDATLIEGSDATDTLLAQASQALTYYDPATYAELVTQISSVSTVDGAAYTPARAAKLDYLDAQLSTLSTVDGAAYTVARAAKLDYLDAQISGVSTVTAAQVFTQAAQALTNYDPPTAAELTSGLAGLNDPTAASVADAVWNEQRSEHVTAGTFGEGVVAEKLNTQAKADVNTEADTALSEYGASTHAAADVLTSLIGADPTAGSLAEAALVARQVAAGKLVVDASANQEAYYDTNDSTVLVTLTHADDTPDTDDITRTVS